MNAEQIIAAAKARRRDFYLEIKHEHGFWSGWAKDQIQLDAWIAAAKKRGDKIVKVGV